MLVKKLAASGMHLGNNDTLAWKSWKHSGQLFSPSSARRASTQRPVQEYSFYSSLRWVRGSLTLAIMEARVCVCVCVFSWKMLCCGAVARGPNGKITTHIHHNCMRDSLLRPKRCCAQYNIKSKIYIHALMLSSRCIHAPDARPAGKWMHAPTRFLCSLLVRNC